MIPKIMRPYMVFLNIILQNTTIFRNANFKFTKFNWFVYLTEEFYRLNGIVDYIFKVLVPSLEKYNEFYRKLTDKVDFSEVTSSFSMEVIKQTSNLPLHYI